MKYKNIVLIDDDTDDHEIFYNALREVSNDSNCTFYNDGEEALHSLLASSILPDAIFVDLNMPKIGGVEFLYIARHSDLLKDLPIYIYSTGTSLEITKLKIKEATGYITKPDHYSELVLELKKIFN